jgi:hypothetical protein
LGSPDRWKLGERDVLISPEYNHDEKSNMFLKWYGTIDFTPFISDKETAQSTDKILEAMYDEDVY